MRNCCCCDCTESNNEDECCPDWCEDDGKVMGRFGLAFVAETPNCCPEPIGWQMEFHDTPLEVKRRCIEMIQWANCPPLPKCTPCPPIEVCAPRFRPRCNPCYPITKPCPPPCSPPCPPTRPPPCAPCPPTRPPPCAPCPTTRPPPCAPCSPYCPPPCYTFTCSRPASDRKKKYYSGRKERSCRPTELEDRVHKHRHTTRSFINNQLM